MFSLFAIQHRFNAMQQTLQLKIAHSLDEVRMRARRLRLQWLFDAVCLKEVSKASVVSLEHSAGVTFDEVVPAQIYRYVAPRELISQTASSTRDQQVVQAPPVGILSVREGLVCTDPYSVLLLSNGTAVEEASFSPHVEYNGDPFKWPRYHVASRMPGTLAPLHIGGSNNNYFHWLFDLLPKAILLKKHVGFDQIDHFLFPPLIKPFQRQTLRALGLPLERILDARAHPRISADRIVCATNPRQVVSAGGVHAGKQVPAWVPALLKDSFHDLRTSSEQKPIPRLYVSRGDAQMRRIANEEALIDCLREYNFTPVHLSALSLAQQVELFRQAEIIVAPHGAGLANLAFCKKGTTVIELFGADYTNFVYAECAINAGLRYLFLICPAASASPKFTIRKQAGYDFSVPIPRLRNLVNCAGL